MSGNINNRVLLIVLLGLAAVLVITRLLTSKKSERTLETELIDIDTSRISEIYLYPRAESGGELVFTRKDNNWMVSNKEISSPADKNAIENSLIALLDLKIERLVSRSRDKWGDYQVDDSLGTRVVIKEGKKTTLDLVVGRFDYQQPQGGYQAYNRNQFSGVSYVRDHSDQEVYATEGFLSMNFNQNFNRWRDQTLISLSPSQVSKFTFDYPADSGFVAQRSGTGQWMVAGLPADSASMARYVNSVSRKRSMEFEDGFQPVSQPDYQLTIEGDNMMPLHLRGYLQPDGSVILNSSQNPESWFRSDREGLFSQIFKHPEDL